jgi:hypothetical protein
MSGSSIYGTTIGLGPSLHVKQGATLQLLMALTNDDGTAFDLTSVAATAQVRDLSNNLIATLTVAPTGTAGQLSVTQATDAWVPGRYLSDFKFVQGSIVLKSQTYSLIVDPPVTA